MKFGNLMCIILSPMKGGVMLNFILDTFKNNPKLNAVILDGEKIEKSKFLLLKNNFLEVKQNVFLNLNLVKHLEFYQVPTPQEEINSLERRANLLDKL